MSLYLTDGRNLGGALAAFDYKALTLEQMSQLVFADKNVTLSEPTRGLFIKGKGGRFSVENGLSATILPSITYGGVAGKTGRGMLALGGEALFVDGKATTLPVSGSNVFNVAEGDLKVLNKDACNGLALSFAVGSRLVLDLEPSDENLRKYGLVNTKGDCAMVSVADGYSLPVVLDLGGRTCPTDMEMRLGLFTLGSHDAAKVLMDRLSVAKPCKGYGVKTSLADNPDGSTTIVADVCSLGLLLIVR